MTFVTRSSHVRIFERCQRRWYFEEIMKHRAEDTSAMRFGTAMHAELERWLRDGTSPDLDRKTAEGLYPGQAARKSLHLLPLPGGDLMVEHQFVDKKLVAGADYFGTVDLANPREGASIDLYDHKSTAGLAFAKTVTELQQDVSATFYAHQLRWLWGEPTIKSRWIYTERVRSGQVKAVDFDLTSAMIDDRLATTVKSVESMVQLSATQSHIDAPPNWDACNDYNRKCPHWGKCELTKSATVPAEESKVNLLAKVANGIHPKTDDALSVKPPAAGKMLSLRDKLAAAKALAQPSTEKLLETSIAMNVAADTAVQEVAAQMGQEAFVALDVSPVIGAVGVNPPDAAPPTFEAAVVEQPKVKKSKKQKDKQFDPEEIIAERSAVEIAIDHIEGASSANLVAIEDHIVADIDEIAVAAALIAEAHASLAPNAKTAAQQQALVRLSEAAFWLGPTK